MTCCLDGFSRDAQLQATGNKSCCICTLHAVMEINNGQPALCFLIRIKIYKLDPEPDPHQFADVKPNGMEST
jgi:hypothetical protein